MTDAEQASKTLG